MKNHSIPIILLVLVSIAFADTTFFNQDFNSSWSTTTPPAGWTIYYEAPAGSEDWHRDSAGTWSDNFSSYALITSYKNSRVITEDSLISPIINCYRYRDIVLRCSTYFQHRQGDYTAKIIGSIDGGTTYPYTIQNYHGQYINRQLETINLDWAKEKDSVCIAFVFSGEAVNIGFWCLDNISLTGTYVFDTDISCINIIKPFDIQPPSTCSVKVSIANLGKLDIINIPVCCSIIDWTGNPVHFASITHGSLNKGETADVTLLPPWEVPNTPWFYQAKAQCELPGDENTTNDSIEKSFSVSWTENISYCDDNPVSAENFPIGEQGWGMKFTPNFYPARINRVECFLGNLGPGASYRYKIRIVDDDGTDSAPGTTLYETPMINGNIDWNTAFLFLQNIFITEGSFYVFYIQVDDVPNAPLLYHDGSVTPNIKYYKYEDNAYSRDFPDGDWLIHLVLEYYSAPVYENDLRTVFISQPLEEFVRRPFNYTTPVKVRIENIGTVEQTDFAVICTIVSYYSNQIRQVYNNSIASLLPFHDTVIEFAPPWNVIYNEPAEIMVHTYLPLDQNPGNNLVTKVVWDSVGKFTGRDGSYGYAWYDSDSTSGPVYSWNDISAAYLLTDIGDDSLIPLPPPLFSFPYYDTVYNQVYVSTNGYITFVDSQEVLLSENSAIPSAQLPNCALYPFWDDLILPDDHTAKIYFQFLYSTPDSQLVVTWYNIARKNTDYTNRLSFQVILHKDGTVIFQYNDVNCGAQLANDGKSATVGIENRYGTAGLQYLYGSETAIDNWPENKLSSMRAIKFYKQLRDVGPLLISTPPDSLVPGPITPNVVVKNWGSEPLETLKVYLTITKAPGIVVYDTFKVIPRLVPGEERTIQLPDWNAFLGRYAICCSTSHAQDQISQNNVIRDSVFVLTWVMKARIPQNPDLRRVKNGALTYAYSFNKIFALKGGNCNEFWCYDIETNTWESLPRMPLGPSNKKPKSGCALAYAGGSKIYVLKGGNKGDFYEYDIIDQTWRELALLEDPLNAGHKKPKDGASLTYSYYDGLVYAIMGNNTTVLHYYNPGENYWQFVDNVPINPNPTADNRKVKHGASINYFRRTLVPDTAAPILYIFKGNNSRELWRYDLREHQWLERCTIPRAKYKVKSGGTATCQTGTGIIYFFLGGNKQSLWSYNTGNNSFDSLTPIPREPNRKKLKKGAAIVATPLDLIYVFKSGNTDEFWAYAFWAEPEKTQMTTDIDNIITQNHQNIETQTLTSPIPLLSVNPASIDYTLKEQKFVDLKIYSLNGELVRTLCYQEQPAGSYHISLDNIDKQVGIYFIKGSIGTQQVARKIIRF